MAADRGMVAKNLVLHGWLSSSNGVEKVCLMGRHVAIACRRGEGFRLVNLIVERSGLRMVGRPLRQILLAKPLRPALRGIRFGLGSYILRREGQSLPNDLHCSFGAVESDRLTACVVQITAQHHEIGRA